MKTLKVWIVVLAMLAVSAPSFGYVLVYNVVSRINAVDSIANSLVGAAAKSYLFMDINEVDGEVNDSYWLIYGKDGDGTKTYILEEPYLDSLVCGKYQSIHFETVEGGWSVTVIGKVMSKSIGTTNKKLVAYAMSGNLIIQSSGIVLDMSQSLTGAGSMVLMLNSVKTKAANNVSAPMTIDDAVSDITDAWDVAGYISG